jgi:hypothetical protein
MADFGKPAIPTPRGIERDLATAISNIRERIERIEASLSRAVSIQEAARPATSSSTSTLASLQAQIDSLKATIDAWLASGAPIRVYIDGTDIGVTFGIDFIATDAARVSGLNAGIKADVSIGTKMDINAKADAGMIAVIGQVPDMNSGTMRIKVVGQTQTATIT